MYTPAFSTHLKLVLHLRETCVRACCLAGGCTHKSVSASRVGGYHHDITICAAVLIHMHVPRSSHDMTCTCHDTKLYTISSGVKLLLS